MDRSKIDKAHGELLEVLQKHRLTSKELIVTYGNLGYSLGASIEKITGEGPIVDKLKQMYYSKPSLGIALMLQGILTVEWVSDIDKTK